MMQYTEWMHNKFVWRFYWWIVHKKCSRFEKTFNSSNLWRLNLTFEYLHCNLTYDAFLVILPLTLAITLDFTRLLLVCPRIFIAKKFHLRIYNSASNVVDKLSKIQNHICLCTTGEATYIDDLRKQFCYIHCYMQLNHSHHFVCT